MRRTLVIFSAAGLLAGACGDSGGDETLDGSLASVVVVEVSGRDHVLGEVDYPTSPPAGGEHFGAWQNCGFYDVPLIDEVAVHSLEHGAVWVTYRPETSPDVLGQISLRQVEEGHMLVSPYADQSAPLVLTAWGRQLEVERWDDPAVDAFLDQYLGRSSPTAPEAGVSCQNGVGDPPSDPDLNYDEAFEAMSDLES